MKVIIDNPFISTIVNNEVVSGINMTFKKKTKISEIKEKVSRLTSIPIQYFGLALIREEETMNPNSTLAEYTRPSVVRLRMVIDVPQRDGSVDIFVKTSTGERLTLTVHPGDWIPLVKYFIFKQVGLSPNMQRLIFAGRQIENERTLSDYNIGQHSTIHLVPRLLGCGSTRVTVVGPGGDEYIYTSPCCCYVTTVKSIITQKTGIPMGEQRLLLEEVEVEDGEKLKKYTDQLEVRLRLQVIPVA